MWWGSFSGIRIDGSLKGPGFFWEKELGSIGEETYRQHTIPIIDGWIEWAHRQGVELLFMHDNAPRHKADGTVEDLRERGVRVIDWSPFSPDLNPTESVWNKMKDWIEDKHGLIEKPSHDQLRRWTKEVWEAVDEAYLEELIESIPQRCKDVIAANGSDIKW